MGDGSKYEMSYSSTTHSSYGQPTTVVMTQPTAGGVVRLQQRDWNSGVFDCMRDMKICLCGLCCCPCLACQVSSDMGEFVLLPCCLQDYLVVLRAKFRTQQGIAGTVLGDCCCAAFCHSCTLCQLKRELEECRANGSLNNQN